MLAMLPRLKTIAPHQISSHLTLTKKRISNVFEKEIFAYLLMAPLKVDTYNYAPTSITGSFSFTVSLVVTSKNYCALTKVQTQKKKSSCETHLSTYTWANQQI
jgi:polyphosphate kinase